MFIKTNSKSNEKKNCLRAKVLRSNLMNKLNEQLVSNTGLTSHKDQDARQNTPFQSLVTQVYRSMGAAARKHIPGKLEG